ncbi:MAG: DUF481 domain-containing protein [Pseudomonadota bacterium]
MRRISWVILCLGFTGQVAAQDAVDGADAPEEPAGLSGEASLSAGYTTGNTDTQDVGAALSLQQEWTKWTLSFNATADYAEADNRATQERYYVDGQLDRKFNERFYGFGRSSYERDEFSGFESRTFGGLGLGYNVLIEGPAVWTVDASGGVRVDDVRASLDETGAIVTPASSTTSFSARGASDFAYTFNENVSFTNLTSVNWAEESTQILNTAAINAGLIGDLSLRFSFDVRHDTNPPNGFEATDTATKAALVYGFGG